MSDSIKVFARVRPFNSAESASEKCLTVSNEGKSVIVNAPQPNVSSTQAAAGYGAMMRGVQRSQWASHNTNTPTPNASAQNTFHFDHVYDSSTSQYLFYQQATAPLLEDLMLGYNTVIMAYGQTGSGKTHTMQGSTPATEEITPTSAHGVMPRFIQGIFDYIDDSDESIEFTIKVSVLEIYMERIKDLLSGQDGLRIRDNSNNVWVEELTQVYVTSIDEVFSVISTGQSMRAVASTNMNDASSRSHLIVQITIGQHFSNTGEKRGSQLTFVDLAGSEKVAKTLAEGQTLKEAQHINKSLSALGNVINACSAKLPHVPYRDSKLTHLLRDSIAGNSKTALIIACSPSGNQYDETLSTCRFGQRAATIQNKPILNRERSIEEYKSLFLNTFRLVVKRTSLLAATHQALDICIQEHQDLGQNGTNGNENDISKELIQQVFLETDPGLQIKQLDAVKHKKKDNGNSNSNSNNNNKNPPEKEKLEQNIFFISKNIIDALEELCHFENDRDIISFLGGEIINPLTNSPYISSDSTSDPSTPKNIIFNFSNLGKTDSTLTNSINTPLQQSTKPEDDDLSGLNQNEQFLAKIKMLQERNNKMIIAMKGLETQHGLQLLSLTNDLEAKEQDIIRLRTEVTDSYIHQQTLQDELQSLNQDILSLKGEKDNQNDSIEQLNTQLEKFTSLLKQKDITIKSLCDETNARQEQQLKYESQLIQRVEKSRFVLEQKESVIKSLKETKDTTAQDYSQLQEQYNALFKLNEQAQINQDELHRDYQKQINELKEKVETFFQYKNVVEKKNLECNILTEQVQLLEQSVKRLNESIEQLHQQNLSYEKELAIVRAERDALVKSCDPNNSDKKMIEDLQVQNIELQKSFTTISGDYHSLKTGLAQSEEKNRLLNLKFQQSEKDAKTVSNRLHDIDMQLNDRTQRMITFEKELDECKKEKELIGVSKQHLQQHFDKLTDQFANKELEYISLQEQYTTAQIYAETLKAEIEKLTKKLDQTTNLVDDNSIEGVSSLKQKVLALQNEKSTNTQQLTLAQQQIAALEKSLKDLHELFTETQDENLILEQKNQNLTKKYAKLEDSSQDRFLELEKEKHFGRYQFTKLQDEYNKLLASSNANNTTVNDLEEKIAILTAKNKELGNKNEMLSLRLDTTVSNTNEQISNLNEAKTDYVSYKENTQKELSKLTTQNVTLQQEVLSYKSKFVLLENNLQIFKQQAENTQKESQEKLNNLLKENAHLKETLSTIKSTTSNDVSNLQEKYNLLSHQHTALMTSSTALKEEHSELKIKYVEEKQMATKQVSSLQSDLQQQIELHQGWQTQQESLLQEKCTHFQAIIAKNKTEIDQLNQTINLLRVEQDSLKRETGLSLSEQNKYHAQEIIVLREQHHQELQKLNSERNLFLSEKTEIEQTCLSLQDLNSIQQSEFLNLETIKKRQDEKISNLQIQWEQNIHQQMSYEELMQGKIDALERILTTHNIPFVVGADGLYSVEGMVHGGGDDDEGEKKRDKVYEKKGGFFNFGSKSNESSTGTAAAQLRVELKLVQTELEEKKSFIEKKEKQHQRLNTNFLEKCREYDLILKEVQQLKDQIEDNKYEMGKLEVLFENPDEIVTLRDENKTLNAKILELTERNRTLQINEYSARKKHGNIVAPGGGTTIHQIQDGNIITSTSTQVDAMVSGVGVSNVATQRKNAVGALNSTDGTIIPSFAQQRDSKIPTLSSAASYHSSVGESQDGQRRGTATGMNKFF
jgi:chromosome segregation ATPase